MNFCTYLFLALAVLLVPTAAVRADAHEIRLATLAPEGSSWMKVFHAWNKTLQAETKDQVKLRFYPGGSQGDESEFISKIRAGQLDAAGVTSTGLGIIARPVVVLAIPGLFENYEELDRTREKMNPYFKELFEKNGYVLLGWGDAGIARMFSKVKFMHPNDLKPRRNWAWPAELVFNEVLNELNATRRSADVMQVLFELEQDIIDTLPASALAAVSFQWYSHLKFVAAQPMGVIIGATVIKKSKFDELGPDQQSALLSTGARAHKVLRQVIRKDDEKAYKTIIAKGIQPVAATPEVEQEWRDLGKRVEKRLVGKMFPQSVLDKVYAAKRGN